MLRSDMRFLISLKRVCYLPKIFNRDFHGRQGISFNTPLATGSVTISWDKHQMGCLPPPYQEKQHLSWLIGDVLPFRRDAIPFDIMADHAQQQLSEQHMCYCKQILVLGLPGEVHSTLHPARMKVLRNVYPEPVRPNTY